MRLIDYEVIVVDNASSDGSVVNIPNEFPEVTLIRNETNHGFAKANNQGLLHASGDYIFLLNADTLLLDENISTALNYIQQEGCAIVSPMLLNEDGSLQRSFSRHGSLQRYIANIFSLAFGIGKLFKQQETVPTQPDHSMEFLLGAAMLIDRHMIEKLELFDEAFFFTGEERDMCMRYLDAGEKLGYLPDWKILHYGGSGNPHSLFQIENWVKSSVGLGKKHGSWFDDKFMRLGLLLFLFSYRMRFTLRWLFGNDKQSKKNADVYGRVLRQYIVSGLRLNATWYSPTH